MTSSSDHFEEPRETVNIATVDEIRDRFINAGLPCKTERNGNEMRLTFEGRKCFLKFIVNAAGRPLTASMPDTTDYDPDFAQVVFGVFDSIGWKFQR